MGGCAEEEAAGFVRRGLMCGGEHGGMSGLADCQGHAAGVAAWRGTGKVYTVSRSGVSGLVLCAHCDLANYRRLCTVIQNGNVLACPDANGRASCAKRG